MTNYLHVGECFFDDVFLHLIPKYVFLLLVLGHLLGSQPTHGEYSQISFFAVSVLQVV